MSYLPDNDISIHFRDDGKWMMAIGREDEGKREEERKIIVSSLEQAYMPCMVQNALMF